MCEWISVKDGLPEIDKVILANVNDVGTVLARYDKFGTWEWQDLGTDYSVTTKNEDGEITHWSPLIEVPK